MMGGKKGTEHGGGGGGERNSEVRKAGRFEVAKVTRIQRRRECG